MRGVVAGSWSDLCLARAAVVVFSAHLRYSEKSGYRRAVSLFISFRVF